MRRTSALVLSVLAGACLLTGCQSTPRPAKTTLEGAESHVISERDEKRPIESRWRFKAEVPTEEPPAMRIRITLPDAAPAPEPSKDGGR